MRVLGLLKKEKKLIKYTNPKPVGIPSGSQAGRLKKQCILPAPPRIGNRPKIGMEIMLGSGVWVKIVALLDSGSSCCILDSDFVKKWEVPKVCRDVPATIKDFHGSVVEGAGEAFTFPLIIKRKEHVSKDTFEIAPLDKEVDIILPWWWMIIHKPNGFFDGSSSSIEFTNITCKDKCTARAMDKFALEYDENLLESVNDFSAIGIIGSINTNVVDEKPSDISWTVSEKYRQFSSLATREVSDALPPHRLYDHAIETLPNERPPWGPVYALSEKELEVLREYLEEMLRTGKIRPSKSPAGAPILFVPKTHGRGLRLCVDYRGLNKVTILNKYPLPLMDELQDRVRGASIFTKIDLKSGYNLIRIRKGDEWKTAFRTRYGHYEYLVMPFGLANAPATFQNMMNDIFRDLLDQGVIVYIDDILIYSDNAAEHDRLKREVLQRLQTHSLALAPDKCEWDKSKIEFLGYVISAKGLIMSTDKIDTIMEWGTPSSMRDVQSFLGFANFYRRFIQGFSKVCRPLTDSLRNADTKTWKWTDGCDKSFQELKRRFTSAPILRHFDPRLPTVLETDASDFAVGAVFSQTYQNRLHPCAFYSRKMVPAEMNYEIHDKEMLAVVAAFKQWRRYLEGALHQVQVYTDHKNLEFFTTTKVLNRRQARWAIELAAYDFKIFYRPGSANGKPDALSRRSEFAPSKEGSEKHPIETLLHNHHFNSLSAPSTNSSDRKNLVIS